MSENLTQALRRLKDIQPAIDEEAEESVKGVHVYPNLQTKRASKLKWAIMLIEKELSTQVAQHKFREDLEELVIKLLAEDVTQVCIQLDSDVYAEPTYVSGRDELGYLEIGFDREEAEPINVVDLTIVLDPLFDADGITKVSQLHIIKQ